jgi:DNA helicase-2/ATP-dependent DNA helicase PcrA
VQLDIVKLLAGEGDGFFAVGDDDQSIFSWRGARVENIVHLNKDFPHLEVMTLERNYRSTQTILDAAFHAIAANKHLVEKRLRTDRGPGEKIRLLVCDSEAMEARVVVETLAGLERDGIPLDHMAIFYRTNAQSRPFEEALRRMRIPHRVVGGFRFFERAEVKDILAYARLVANPKDTLSFLRCINNPPRGLGPTTVGELVTYAQQRQLPLLEAAREFGGQKSGKAGKSLVAFADFMAQLKVLSQGNLVDFFRGILDLSGYRARLDEDDGLEAEGRKENLGELLGSVAEYLAVETQPSLDDYLQRISLVSSLDEGGSEKALSLMTIHTAKGLEFDAVFLTGLEEGLFPHEWSRRDGGMDEERRLLHVAITRARDKLFISLARTRARFGTWTRQEPSSLLAALPSWLFEVRRGPARQSFGQMYPGGRYVDRSDSQLPDDDLD